jgi:hypothetical protein
VAEVVAVGVAQLVVAIPTGEVLFLTAVTNFFERRKTQSDLSGGFF